MIYKHIVPTGLRLLLDCVYLFKLTPMMHGEHYPVNIAGIVGTEGFWVSYIDGRFFSQPSGALAAKKGKIANLT